MNTLCATRTACWRVTFTIWFAGVLALPGRAALANDLESNLKLMPVASFSGLVDSIPLPPIYGENLQTGPITLSLDTSAANFFGLDNVLEQGKIDVTLKLDSPLFSALGETPSIHIVETGPAYVTFPQDDWPPLPYDFLFHADLTGGGTIASGLFAGTTFHNLNAYDGDGLLGSWIVRPDSTVTWNVQNDGSVTFPDGTVVSNVGGSGSLLMAPEPSSIVLGGFAVATLIALWRKRVRRSA